MLVLPTEGRREGTPFESHTGAAPRHGRHSSVCSASWEDVSGNERLAGKLSMQEQPSPNLGGLRPPLISA